MIHPLGFLDRQIVDAGDAYGHQALIVKLPIFVTVTPKPLPAVVVPLIREAHRDSVLTKCPDLFNQSIVQLTLPFARQKGFDLSATLNELIAVSPAAVLRVRQGDAAGFSAVPGIFSHARLL